MKIKYEGPFTWPKAHYNDAGHDVIIPHDVTVGPFCSIAINTLMRLYLPDGTMAVMMPRSSLSKRGIIVNMSPIDAGYRGQVHVLITNNNKTAITIAAGSKICNCVVVPIIDCEFVKSLGEERGDSAFGSSGK